MLGPGCSSSQSVREVTERDFKTAEEAQERICSSSSSDEEEEEVRSLEFKGQNEDKMDTLDTESHDLLSVDPGLWPTKLTDKDRATIVCKLSQKEERDMPHDSQGKPFPDYLKYCKAANGRVKMRRDWLIYSESTDALFCIPCVLFSQGQKRPSHSLLNSDQGYKMSDVKWHRMINSQIMRITGLTGTAI